MRSLVKTLFLVVAIALVPVLPAGQNKVVLAVKGDPGQSGKYQLDLEVGIEAGGQKFTMNIKQVESKTVKEVKDGNIAFVQATESQEITMNGEKLDPDPDENKPSTVTVRPDGTLVSYESEGDGDAEKMNVRIMSATSVIFSKNPVGVGDKWSYQYKDDDKLGTKAGSANFQLLAFEKAKDVDCAKIKMTFEEAGGSPRFASDVTAWVELATGDTVKSDVSLTNFPLGEGAGTTSNAKGTMERTSGGPLKANQGSATPAEPKKEKDIDETVKDYEKLSGLFTLYRKREGSKDTVYMEILESQVDKLFLLQATAATGNSQQVVAGNPINDLVLKFSKIDDRLFLVRPNLGFVADGKTPTGVALDRSFSDAYLEAFKIEAKQEKRKSLLINVSDLFKGDVAQVNAAVAGGGNPLAALPGGGGGFSQDRDKTFIVQMKAFPENIFVQTNYAFNRSGGGGGGLMDLLGPSVMADPRNFFFKVNYNLSMLPTDGYMPRRFDGRVGYFTSDYRDFSDPTKFDNTVRNILRWRLEKKDPSAAMSEPKKPIVFWLDNAIPHEYREAVKEGVLLWNKAFEKIGYKNAVVVNQMPADADWDPSDMRYNVVRWVLSPDDAYAVALFRVNPITGEILNASILVDGNMVRYTERERSGFVDPASFFEPKKNDPRHVHDPRRCSLQQEICEQAAFGKLALDMLGGLGNVDEHEYMNTFLRHVVCHEMGHILGLRHNFISSTQLTFAQMGNPDLVRKHGTAASVMEYTPFNLAALKKNGVDWWPASIGDYDYWAVAYGYMHTGARKPEDEVADLKRLAAQCNASGNAYQSDETADSIDPRITRFDLAANPLDYWAKTMEVSRYMGMNLGQRLPKHGESFWTFTRDFNMLFSMIARAASQCTRYIGAMHLNNNFKGDPGQKPPIAAASFADQKRALDLLNTYIFSEQAFNYPKEYYQRFTANPDADLLQAILGGSNSFPVLDQFASIQGSALRTIFRPDVLSRVVNNEFKASPGSNPLRLVDLFDDVRKTVWAELTSSKNVSALRRRLQRAHVDRMIAMVINTGDGAPDDAKMLAWRELRSLKASLDTQKRKKAIDKYTQVHYEDCAMRIQRALEARPVVGAPSGGGGMSPLQQLLGGG
ncbi:MAG TPA: zinc-dependent metalloprotease [Fimbriimonadaceae bacterium]|nr:zinc-dependent metalloprotease [Fimbriimonadaceae bacterium]HRJ95550.1 zinc-dependent metalloprotease [Fimbriimonadaceae bacterium]